MTNRVKQALLAMQRHNWEQGVAAQAFLESGDEDIAIAMAVEGANRQGMDGRCCQLGDSSAVTDPCAIGEALIFACEKTGDPFLLAARDRLLHWALHDAPRSAEGVVYHFLQGKLIWVDSMYMLPPFLARAGEHDEAIRQLDGYWAALHNPANGLLSHQWSDAEGRFLRRDAWAVGNGWAMAGMARVIALLPESHAQARQRLISRTRGLIESALTFQREDGAFHDVLDDPASFREVNFAQMLAYTVYRGVADGWLDASLLSYAEKARSAALAEVDAYGLVRNVCGAHHFDKAGVAPEGQAFHILMEAARKKLLRFGKGQGCRRAFLRLRADSLLLAGIAAAGGFLAAGRDCGCGRISCGWASCFSNPVDSRKARAGLRCGAGLPPAGRGLRGPFHPP